MKLHGLAGRSRRTFAHGGRGDGPAAGGTRQSFRPRGIALGAGLCLALGTAAAAAQAPAAGSAGDAAAAAPVVAGRAPVVAGRAPAPYPPLRLASTAAAAPGSLGAAAWRISALRGEVVLRHIGTPAEEPVPPTAALPLPLARGDELITRTGAAEVTLANGMVLQLSADAQVSVVGPTTIALTRAEVQVTARPGLIPQPVYFQCPVGKFPIKARDARVRCDADGTTVAIYDGVARLGGLGTLGVTVLGGLVSRWSREGTPQPPRPVLDAPQWGAGQELLLSYGSGGVDLGLRWQPVPSAQRYRVELFRDGGEAPLSLASLLSQTEITAPRTVADLRQGEVGGYVARVYAIDEFGAPSPASQPRRVVVAQLSGITADDSGALRVEPGVLPQLSAPGGQTGALLIDGEAPGPGAPAPGPHRLRALVGTLSAELSVVARGKSEPPVVAARPNLPQSELGVPDLPETQRPVATTQGEPAQGPGEGDAALDPAPGAAPATPPVSLSPGPEDTLLGGVGEVPFDGIRSPWAGRLVTLRLESTISGAFRMGFFGRLTMKNGFGAELSISALRATIADVPPSATGLGSAGFGNISAALRSPAVRTRRIGFQALASIVAPLSGSSLDTSIEVDGRAAEGGSAFRPDIRARGGGWRIEPALLFGVRFDRFTLSTTQGASLHVRPGFTPSYAGSVALHADLVPQVRFMTFASWQVGYLGVPVEEGDQTPDVGGAVGAGFEGLIPAGRLGQLRLALTGRAGLGNAGVAVYGRGTLGLQVGYRFR